MQIFCLSGYKVPCNLLIPEGSFDSQPAVKKQQQHIHHRQKPCETNTLDMENERLIVWQSRLNEWMEDTVKRPYFCASSAACLTLMCGDILITWCTWILHGWCEKNGLVQMFFTVNWSDNCYNKLKFSHQIYRQHPIYALASLILVVENLKIRDWH